MFKYWFIGFTEGDGSFIISKTGYLEFKITQSSIDTQILFYIKKNLGFGTVSIQDKVNKTHHYRVRNKEGIIKLIEIFNGNLYTEKKLDQFKKWLEAFNLLYGTNIIFNNKINVPCLNNSWLSGFTDAAGCFTVSIINQSLKYKQVQVRYILSKKGEFKLLSNIANLLGGKVSYLKNYDEYNMVINLIKLNIIIKYFKVHCLKTKKYISYLNWLKVYKLVINKKHFNNRDINVVLTLINKNI